MKPNLKTIDGVTYSLVPVGGWEAIPLFHDLVSILGSMTPVFAELVAGDSKKPLLERFKLEKIFEALPGFLARASPAEIRKLTEQMLVSCTFRRPLVKAAKPTSPEEAQLLLPVFDLEMSGKLLTTFKLLAWAIEVNFSDFFSGAKLAAAARAAAASAEAQSKTEGSTDS